MSIRKKKTQLKRGLKFGSMYSSCTNKLHADGFGTTYTNLTSLVPPNKFQHQVYH